MRVYELDRLQCQAETTLKKRCTRIATHHNGGKLLCENHHQMYLVKRANGVPIKKEGDS